MEEGKWGSRRHAGQQCDDDSDDNCGGDGYSYGGDYDYGPEDDIADGDDDEARTHVAARGAN